MRDQKWIGVSPSDYRWSADSKTVYFNWNPEGKENSELYGLEVSSGKLKKEDKTLVDKAAGLAYRYNASRSFGVAEKEGDLSVQIKIFLKMILRFPFLLNLTSCILQCFIPNHTDHIQNCT